MAFCSKCGNQLKETDRFCSYCGEPVRLSAQAPPQAQGPQAAYTPTAGYGQAVNGYGAPVNPGQFQPYPGMVPKKQSRARPFLIAVCCVLAAAVILITVLSLTGDRNDISVNSPEYPSSLSESGGEAAQPPADTVAYNTYTNSETLFAFDYPKDFDLRESAVNTVFIYDSDDFRVAAEYNYATASGSFIYSAADFSEQIDADPRVLNDWVGSSAVVTDFNIDDLNGQTAYHYEYETLVNGIAYTGQLYLVEGRGEYGCYSFQTLTADEKEERYEDIIEHMEDSFRIIGAYQAQGFKTQSFGGGAVRFAVLETAGEPEEYGTGTSISFCPVDGVFSQSNIQIEKSSYDTDEIVAEDLLFNKLIARFQNVEIHGNGYEAPEAEKVGLYPYYQIESEFYEEDVRFTLIEIALDVDGTYWTVEAQTTDEYEDETREAIELLLMSLRFD